MEESQNWINKIQQVNSLANELDKKLFVLSVLTEIFIKNDLVPPVLVGGSAVALYSRGLYSTIDIDMVHSGGDKVFKLLEDLGYKRAGKDWFNPTIESLIEFPSSTLDGSWDRVMLYTTDYSKIDIQVIGLEDLILDRVEAFNSTKDLKSKEWSIRLMLAYYEIIDWSYYHKSANARGFLNTAEKVQRAVKGYLKYIKDLGYSATSETIKDFTLFNKL